MKRAAVFVAFFVVLGVALTALYHTQRRNKQSDVSANAVLKMAADAQRDLTRVPMHFTRLSDSEEIAIGRELAAQYDAQQNSLSEHEEVLRSHTRRVGEKLAAHAKRQLPYSFHLVPDRNMLNAFSLPGGPVFVGEGMLEQFETEDELANLLAHEIEHIDHYHAVERVQIEARLKQLNLDVLGEVLQLPIGLWQAGYEKDEELEADREGMFLAVAAGYSPYGAVQLLERFAKLNREYVIHAETPEQEFSELAIQSLNGYFRSHPPTSERLAQARQIIAQRHWEELKESRPFRG
jgi:beta-barrel assembly-enhancing protease